MDSADRHCPRTHSPDAFIAPLRAFAAILQSRILAFAKVIYVDAVPIPPLTKMGMTQFADFENMNATGITFLDTFFCRQEMQNNESLHFHELVHIVQWKLMGAKNFVAAYAGGLERFGYRNSPLEVMAYDAQDVFDKSSQPFDVERLVKANEEFIGHCLD